MALRPPSRGAYLYFKSSQSNTEPVIHSQVEKKQVLSDSKEGKKKSI